MPTVVANSRLAERSVITPVLITVLEGYQVNIPRFFVNLLRIGEDEVSVPFIVIAGDSTSCRLVKKLGERLLRKFRHIGECGIPSD